MKIIHTDTDDMSNPLAGGAPVRTYEINRRLAKQHDITVLTATYPGAQRCETKDNVSYKRLGTYIPPVGISYHLTYLYRIRAFVKKYPHDLVIEEFMPPVGFCGLPWKTNKPVISMVQWYFFEFWEKRYHLPFQEWMKKISNKKKYKHFIVQTNQMGETIKKLIPQANICKIPCGINPSAFISPTKTCHDDFVLFLGRLDIWQKGIDTLLDAWVAKCAQEKIKLIIAGGGESLPNLKKKVKNLGLEHLISFSGPVHDNEKRNLLSNCRFLVMPSREETFGLVALEAMAAGKAVIAFDIDHLNELLQTSWSELIFYHNSDRLGDAVCHLWKNKPRSIHLGKEGRKQAIKYSWDHLASQQESFYQSILEGDRI